MINYLHYAFGFVSSRITYVLFSISSNFCEVSVWLGTTATYQIAISTRCYRRRIFTPHKRWKVHLEDHRGAIKIGFRREVRPVDMTRRTHRPSRVVERGRDRKWSPMWKLNMPTAGSAAVAVAYRSGSRRFREETTVGSRITLISRAKDISVSTNKTPIILENHIKSRLHHLSIIYENKTTMLIVN